MNKDFYKKGCNLLALKAKKRDMSVSVFGLEKVPAESLLRLALEEIGEQESYIEELEEKIRIIEMEKELIRVKERKALTREIKTEAFLLAKRNHYYSKLESKLTRQGEFIKRLIARRDELLREVLRLKECTEEA